MTDVDELWPCVGVCMPDADEAYCIGCGRPWGEPRPPKPAPTPESTSQSDDEAPSA